MFSKRRLDLGLPRDNLLSIVLYIVYFSVGAFTMFTPNEKRRQQVQQSKYDNGSVYLSLILKKLPLLGGLNDLFIQTTMNYSFGRCLSSLVFAQL